MRDPKDVLLSIIAQLAWDEDGHTTMCLDALKAVGITVPELTDTRETDILISLKLMGVKMMNGREIDLELSDYITSLQPKRPQTREGDLPL